MYLTIPHTFGARLAWIRRAQGLSVRGLARLTEIDPSYLYRLEDDAHSPTIEKLQVLANVLGVSCGQLLGEVELFEETTHAQP
jgi:transcriptional regulator with XRE-family HTH domain